MTSHERIQEFRGICECGLIAEQKATGAGRRAEVVGKRVTPPLIPLPPPSPPKKTHHHSLQIHLRETIPEEEGTMDPSSSGAATMAHFLHGVV